MSVGNLEMLSLISRSDIFSINEPILLLEISYQFYVKTSTMLQIKTVTTVLKSRQTRCDTSDNVCLDLNNCRYSIYVLGVLGVL